MCNKYIVRLDDQERLELEQIVAKLSGLSQNSRHESGAVQLERGAEPIAEAVPIGG